MIYPKKFDWKKYLTESLESTFFCTIATAAEDVPWACPVYFAYDTKFNFYFISQPKSRHMINISGNANISIAIYNTQQAPGGDVAGTYVEGMAKLVPDEEVQAAYDVYYKRRFPDTGKADTLASENMGSNAEWKFVKITPKNIYYFDTRFFDEERQKVPFKELIA